MSTSTFSPHSKNNAAPPHVLIVGGGLAGLTAARLLHRAGIGFQLLEARDRLGGRILSADASGSPAADGFDLEPSWFWPAVQPALAALVAELGVAVFPQESAGDIVFQQTPHETPLRFPGMREEWPSMRIAGGAGALISALAAGLPAERIQLNARVTRVTLDGEEIELRHVRADGHEHNVRASHVLFALPPRLLEATVSFAPALDAQTARRWRDTPTWMAPHAKLVALFERPFWRDAGLSGAARSMMGPLVEIHDATTASGKAALFGFVGVPAGQRRAAGRDAIIAASVQQLASLFGPEAAAPAATLLKDWAADPLTATVADEIAGEHPIPDRLPWVGGKWRGRLLLAGSETSSSEPGYLAGAVQAAERAVGKLIRGVSEAEASRGA
jgi:monoamine oxidase